MQVHWKSFLFCYQNNMLDARETSSVESFKPMQASMQAPEEPMKQAFA